MTNFQITQGTGTVIATDVGGGGENYQKIKLIDATPGSTTGTGIAANPLQISLEFTNANTVPLLVDGSGVIQPVSGTITANQGGVWNLNNISGTISLPTGAATETTLSLIKTDLDQFTFVSSNLLVDGSGVTQPISAISLPLPSGAATEATLSNIETNTNNLDVALSTRASELTVSGIKTQTDKLTFVASRLIVDGSGVTQPVSGTVTVSNPGLTDTQLRASPVPVTGTITTSPNVNIHDGSGTSISSTGSSLNVDVTNTVPVTGTFFQATQPVSGTVTANAGTGTFLVDGSAHTQPVSGTVAATQSGPWTVSLVSESIEIGTVDQGTPNTLANAWPVELTDGTNVLGTAIHPIRIDPTGTTTQPVSISGTVAVTQSTSPWVVSGTITANIGTTNGLALDATLTGGSQQTKIVQGGNTAVVDATGDLQVDVNNFPATQAVTQSTSPWVVSGTVTANIGTTNGLALDATLTGGTQKTKLVDSGGTNVATVSASGALSVNVTTTPTLTKGTQGSTGFAVQELKDAGRVYVTFTSDAVAGTTAGIETLLTMTQNRQGSTTSASNYTITNGKTLRIQSITVGVQSGAGAGEWVRVKLRHNTAGATTTSSALVYTTACGTSQNQAAIGGQVSAAIPDGLEFYGDGTQTIGISHTSSATTNVESITICGYEY